MTDFMFVIPFYIMNLFEKFIHKFEHILGSNEGDIISWREDDIFYISFKCKKCGEVEPPIDHFKLPTEKEPNYDDDNTNP